MKYRAEIGLALRATVAGALSFALAEGLRLPQGYWAVFTAVLVMQASLGGSVKATVDRFIGTLAGAGWGVAILMTVPHGGAAYRALALVLALAPLALMAAFRPSFRVAPVTAVILLLSPTGQAISPLTAALDRVLEIGLGSLVALVVALSILPARAHEILAGIAAEVMEAMATQIALLLGDVAQPVDEAAIRALHDRLRLAIARAETAADEAARERLHHLTTASDPQPLVRTLRRLRHDLAIIGRATAEPLPAPARDALRGPAAEAAEAMGAFFRAAGAALAERRPAPPLGPVDQALDHFAREVGQLRRAGMTRDLSDEDVARLYGLTYALEQLRRNLQDLANRTDEAEFVPH